jgi:hypothetical protein
MIIQRERKKLQLLIDNIKMICSDNQQKEEFRLPMRKPVL